MQRINRFLAIATAFGIAVATCSGAETGRTWDGALAAVRRASPEARIVILDIDTGRLLAAQRLSDAARTLAVPGSSLKPLLLYALVKSRRWDPEHRIACSRQLVVAGRRLACAHPAAPPFDAREALTWSCNSYFANVARTLEPGELGQVLKPTGLLGATGLAANEALAEFRAPRTPEEEELAVLGTEGIRVTPLELAVAYRWLAKELMANSSSRAAQVVQAGLKDSASFGMADQASMGGAAVAGKTGTAASTEASWTHGWFAGFLPVDRPRVVMVVYLPTGRGADAAHVAGVLLAHAPEKQP